MLHVLQFHTLEKPSRMFALIASCQLAISFPAHVFHLIQSSENVDERYYQNRLQVYKLSAVCLFPIPKPMRKHTVKEISISLEVHGHEYHPTW